MKQTSKLKDSKDKIGMLSRKRVSKEDAEKEFQEWWKEFIKEDGPILDALAEYDRTGKLPN